MFKLLECFFLQVLLVALCQCVALAAVGASGYWNIGQGASNYGRGGANLVAPDDPLALAVNPAALASLRGFRLTVGADLVDDNRSFLRAAERTDGQYDEVTNGLSLARAPSPHVFASYHLGAAGLDSMTVALGVWGPPRTDQLFPAEGPQRYSTIANNNGQIFTGLALGYALPYNIQMGATALVVYTAVDLSLALYAGGQGLLCREAEDSRCDIVANVGATDRASLAGIFAISAQPRPWLSLAFSYQLPFDVRAAGELDTEFGAAFRNGLVSLEGNQVEIFSKMPGVGRLGVQLRDPDGIYLAELAVVWEQWSRNQQTLVSPQNIVQRSSLELLDGAELELITLENHFQDSYSVRWGGEALLIPGRLTVRCGFYYESTAVPMAYLSAASFDLDKLGATLGARVGFGTAVWLDLAFGHEHWFEEVVADSKLMLDDLVVTGDTGLSNGTTLGNGVYQNRQLVMLASLGLAFDL